MSQLQATARHVGAHEDGSRAWGESLLARATALVPGLAERGARIEAVEVAYRPWPKVRV